MTKKYILFTVAILLLSCCNKKRQNDDENIFTINIESEKIVKSIKFSELITDCKYVPLETTEECLIGQLNKVEVSNNEIFVLDSRSARAIYRFSKEGKFLNQIAEQGHGPGEYVQPDDISIDVTTGEIAILDRMKIYFYKPDNTYLRDIILPVYSYKIAWYDHRIATYSRDDNDLVLLNENGKQKEVFFKNDEAKKMVMNYPFQPYNEKELLYFAYFDYTIYNISEYSVTPHVKFIFDERMFTDKDIKLLKSDSKSEDNFVWIKYYNENSTHIYMVYLYKRTPYMVIYDKSNSTTTIVDIIGIKNDITFMHEPPLIVGVDVNDYFVAQFDYNDVFSPDELKKIIGTQADSLNEMSNPILLFFKFK
jgi:hypothetical protein